MGAWYEMRRNETESGGLTLKQEKALAALLTEPSAHKAAALVGISRASLFRWLNDPVFAAAYRDARGRLMESTLTALQSASVAAVETLRAVMGDESAPGSVRVSAARAILEHSLKAREIFENEDRLHFLESVLKPEAQ